MQQSSTLYSKNLAKKSNVQQQEKTGKKLPKQSVVQSLLNYSKSLEFKKSNYLNQVELVLS